MTKQKNFQVSEEELAVFQVIRTAGGFKEYIDAQGGFQVAQILDFRSAIEFAEGHIPGAINIPATIANTESNEREFAKQVLAIFPDKSKPIFMYGGNNTQLDYIIPVRISKIGYGRANSNILLGGFNNWKVIFPNEIAQ